MVKLWDIRTQYTQGRLDETTAADHPLTQFHAWFEEYCDSQPPEPNIMTLSTVDDHAQPWTRIVLLKSYDENGFVFYTNYQSNKGQHLAHLAKACVHFFWMGMERQIQIHGTVEKVSREESDAYFHSRPRESQLGAWASLQSQPLTNRAALEEQFAEAQSRFEGKDIPLPEHWGGFRVSPTRMEFWQGGANRLHDRVEYSIVDGEWQKQRLNP